MKKALFFPLQVSLCTVGCFYASRSIVNAQVIPDGTVNTQVNQNGNVAEIIGGQRQGGNLFHSFQDFSVPTGNEAFFNNNADNISNIFSRVTGGNISNIDGAIRANGTANLFLINPAGIIFGENARLDIGGSFYGSSASSILFEDGEFSAVDNLQQPVLTVNAPIGLGFRDEPGDIAVQNANLNVSPGQNFSLTGGEITFDGSIINAFAGNVSLGAASSGTIALDDNLNLNFEDVSLGDISINNESIVNVSGAGGGNILVNARNLTLSENSIFEAGINSSNSTPETQGGDIAVNASQTVALRTGSLFTNRLNTSSSGNAGDIAIEAQNLSLTDDSDLSTTTDGNGNAGNIILDIADNIVLDRTARIRSQVLENGVGNGGDVRVNSNSLTLDNNSALIADVIGQGDGGNIQIGSNSINLDNNSLLIADVKGIGNGGDIDVITDTLTLSEQSSFTTSISGEGNAGDINIQSRDSILLESSRLSANVQPEGVGDAGNINIETDSITLNNNSLLLANLNGIGNGGDINVVADTLTLSEGSSFSTSIAGQGDGGSITINALTDIFLEGSSFLSTRVRETGEGNGGNIDITTTNLSLTGLTKEVGSFIITGSVGVGDAGDIIINASESIVLNPHSTINNKASERSGNSGDTIINSDRLILDGRSFILNGNGDPELFMINNIGDSGNTTINSRIVILDNQSLISNSTFRSAIGEAGDITINTDSLTIAGGSNISSLTENDANGGEININAQNIDLTTGGTIASLTDSDGNAGNITLNVTDQITIDGDNPLIPPEDLRFTVRALQELEPFTGLFASTLDSSSGNGGNIQISNPQTLSISNGGQISVDSQGTGNGGNLSIAAGNLSLDSQSQLIAETALGQTEQQPSNINLFIDNTLSLRGDSLISASALNTADGGNIGIDAEFVIAFPAQAGGNDIIASAREGSGGNISIAAEGIFGIEERQPSPTSNDIDASSDVDGLDGSVNITTPDVGLFKGVNQLNANTIESENDIVRACSVTRTVASAENKFSIVGKGGVPSEPGFPLDSQNVLITEETNSTSSIPQAVETSQGKIQPARGVRVTESGEVILTAYRTDNLGARVPEIKKNCDRI